MTIFHIALRRDWQAAVDADEPYTVSTRGRTLEQVGFIHAALAQQVAGVANLFYRDCEEPLCVLAIDEARLTAELVYERIGGTERFPHIYGPLNRDAVVDVMDLRRSAQGLYTFRFGGS